jgi:hypothetical protein
MKKSGNSLLEINRSWSLYFGPKTIFNPPPLKNDISPPAAICNTVFLWLQGNGYLFLKHSDAPILY